MKIIRLAIKTLLRFRLYSLVNILGLALSLSCFILISRYVYREVTTDHFIKDINRVCFTALEDEERHGKRLVTVNNLFNPDPLDDQNIELASKLYIYEKSQITLGNKPFTVSSVATDSNFLKIYTLPILKKSVSTLLAKPNEAVISEETASKLFGSADPLGEIITSSRGVILTITGVFKEPRTKNSFHFDIIESETPDDRKLVQGQSLVRFRKGTSIKEINYKYEKFKKVTGADTRYRLQFYPYKQLYFDNKTDIPYKSKQSGDKTHLFLLSAMAALLLLIGLFNFINIYTVLTFKRGREFGMKKVFGANGKQLAVQLYAENLFLSAMALLLAWVFVELGSNLFGSYLGMSGIPNSTFDIVLSFCVFFILPVITSLFPFVRYNYSKIVHSIHSVGRTGASLVSRNLFLCCQYIITIFLVITSLFFVRQLNYMMSQDIGYKTENILKVYPFHSPVSDTMQRWSTYMRITDHLKQALDDSPLIQKHVYGPSPLSTSDYESYTYIPGGKRAYSRTFVSNEKYFDLLGIQLLEGRLWDDTKDSYKNFDVIINESAKNLLEITDIENAIIGFGRHLVWYTGIDETRKPEYKVIGVVKDFHTGNLSKKAPPLIFNHYEMSHGQGILVEILPDKKQEAIAYLKEKVEEITGEPLRYIFLEDEVKALYDSDRQLTNILTFFAFIAILISSMGLFSLSLFDIQERFHEIAIRKVNGASSTTILHLLLRKYYKLLGIAFLIAAPLSWLAITRYLEDFAYKAPIAWWLFIVAFAVTASISLVTLIYQVNKASKANPAGVIRAE